MQIKPADRTQKVEKRNFKRTATLFAGLIIDDDRTIQVVVLDLSVNGAKVRVPEFVECGPVVRLNIDRLGEFGARVVWQRENRIGLQFDDSPEQIARRLPESLIARLSEDTSGA